ncbi:MAG: exodeoxyribonuclease III [Gammaproteobacteria bacterium]|nr:MAG: exodeoxyribonuclease III [Gammaproteobacteria bacterium]
MTRFISFNINGIRARQHQLKAIKEQLDPDVMGLQETKVHDDSFPLADIHAIGWHVEFFGQKGHYGVALASKTKPVFVQKGFPTDNEDDQKRLIHCRYKIDGQFIDVINGYFPQGENQAHETKFPAKAKFYADLNIYLDNILKDANHILVMGDMNISPQDNDIGIGEVNRKRWLKAGKCSFLPIEREWYQALLSHNLADTYRKHYPTENDRFSWFDYRSKGFADDPKRGLRIDHILATPTLTQVCHAAGISYDIREMEKPSDHAPIWSDFDLKQL